MRLKLSLLLLIVSSFSFAQQPLTTEQINRLADAGKVYGYVKYFHPFLQYKDINWDSAFAANVEGIIDAKSKEEYAAVIQRMFSSLDDKLTTATVKPKSDTANKVQLTTYSIRDSLLYINMNDAAPENIFSSVQYEALQNITGVKGVIFDRRTPANSRHINDTYAAPIGEDALDWNTNFLKGDILIPSYRSIGYDANAHAYFKETGLRQLYGNAKKEVPLVFIVSNEEQIPVIAIALQQKGKAAIIQEEGRKLVPGNSVNFYIHDSILIKLRTSDAVDEKGFLLVVQPDDTFLPGEPPAVAIAKAEKLILNGIQKDSKFAQHASPPIIRNSNYNSQKYPSLGYRMLAAASIFSTIDHFYTDKNLMDKNWETSYKEMIPKFIEAKDSLEYMQAVAELYANIADSHGYISNTADGFSLRLNPVIQGRGSFVPPVITRVIEDKVVVTGIYNDSVCRKIRIKKGDVILTINGRDAIQMIEDARKYQPASTKASQTFYVCSFILFGKEGQIHKLKVRDKNGKIKDISMPTLSEFKGDFWPPDDYSYRILSFNEHVPVKMLTKDIGYADLTSKLNNSYRDSIVSMLKKTKAFIFDMRGYPHADFALEDLLAKNSKMPGGGKEIVVAPSSPNISSIIYNSIEDTRITTTYLNGNAFSHPLNNADWIYPGEVVVLTNESAQSSAEYTCETIKAISNATIIGSPTAGASGNVADFNIPGGITLHFSSEGILLPNGKSFQRYGVQPDINIRPTIKGIQAGKDEVLERAIKFIQTGK